MISIAGLAMSILATDIAVRLVVLSYILIVAVYRVPLQGSVGNVEQRVMLHRHKIILP